MMRCQQEKGQPVGSFRVDRELANLRSTARRVTVPKMRVDTRGVTSGAGEA